MTFLEAAQEVLTRAGAPLHSDEITERALKEGILQTDGKTPAATMGAQLATVVKKPASLFARVAPATYALKAWVEEGRVEAQESKTLVADYPRYDRLRAVLEAWNQAPSEVISSMRTRLASMRGTPQETLDWSDPPAWIDDRLDGAEAEWARRTWAETTPNVNPRYGASEFSG